ncbi:hypothetical protein RF11_05307 [Thelohanellus kitauei]|uniref:Uncharacterized protein n=1 Tax=Thelohanellus kitauei TaxID=669202 RepID=A0A0C2IUC2_THEKT|nr:hypothetical protein RF11_05307 [Thelohanellus kitauei]
MFEIFTFVFRNDSFIHDGKCQLFTELFLKFLLTNDKVEGFNPGDILDSIIICIQNEQNKVNFINKNGMIMFYICFKDQMTNLENKFLTVWESVYSLKKENASSLIHFEIQKTIYHLMKILSTKNEQLFAKMIVIVLSMLVRLKLSSEFALDVNLFYRITVVMCKNDGGGVPFSKIMINLSVIWFELFKNPDTTPEIDTVIKLTIYSALLSIRICSKLEVIIAAGKIFHVTERIKKILYVIYFYMVAEPIIKPEVKILALPILNVWPRLHDLLLRSHILYNNIKYGAQDDLYDYKCAERVEYFLFGLISELCHERYIHKLEKDKKLLLYEDLKTKHLSLLNNDFIFDVLSKCYKHVLSVPTSPVLTSPQNKKKYEVYSQVMSTLIRMFDQTTYYYNIEEIYYYQMCNVDPKTRKWIVSSYPNVRTTADSSEASKKDVYFKNFQVPNLLRSFQIIYEMKFIFDDILTSFTN